MDNHRQLTRRTSRGPFFAVAFRSPEMATSKPPGYRPPAGHPAGLGHLTVNSTQVTNRAPGAEGTSRRKNTHSTDRGLRVPFADKTRLCPLWTLASLYPCLYLCACACRVNVAPYSPAPDPPTTTANDGPLVSTPHCSPVSRLLVKKPQVTAKSTRRPVDNGLVKKPRRASQVPAALPRAMVAMFELVPEKAQEEQTARA